MSADTSGGEFTMAEARLAFFLQDLRGGGAERAVVRLVNGMVGRGVPLDLVVIRKAGAFLAELDPRVNVVELPGGRTLGSVLGLRAYIDRVRPWAVVASMTHINVAAILARSLARHKPRLVVVEHNQFDRNFAQKRGLVRLAYRAVPLLYRKADVVAGVSEGVRDSIARTVGMAREGVRLLYNPVVTPDLFARSAEPADHPWLAGPDVPVLLGVGRLMRLKNFPLLIEATALLRKRRPVRLIILGDGELRPQLEAQVRALGLQDDVDMPGFRPNPFAFMSRASAFVLSSDWEGHPTVMIEAMACGAPVVATDCVSGPAEILEGGRHGRLVPTGDAAALAAALADTLDAPGPPAARIAHARTFNVEAAVDAYLAAVAWPGCA